MKMNGAATVIIAGFESWWDFFLAFNLLLYENGAAVLASTRFEI